VEIHASFLRSLPAITLAGVNELGEHDRINLDTHGWSVPGGGLFAGSISAFIAVWDLMQIPERFSSWPSSGTAPSSAASRRLG